MNIKFDDGPEYFLHCSFQHHSLPFQVFELLASHDCPEAFAVTRPEMRTFFESHGANFVNDRFPFDHDGEIGKLQTQAARLRELNKQIRAEQSLFGTRRMPLPLAAVARPRRGEDGGETGVSVAVDWTRTYRKSRGFRVDGRKSDYYYRRGAEERGGTLSTRSGSAGHHRQLLRDGGDRKLRDDGDAGVLARGVSHDVAEPQKKFAVDRGMVRPGVLLTSLQQVVEDAVDTKDQVGEPEPPKKRKNPKKKRNFPKRPKKKTAGAQGEMFRKSSKVPSSRRTRKTTGKNRKKARFRVSVQKAWEALLQESVAGNNQRPGLRV